MNKTGVLKEDYIVQIIVLSEDDYIKGILQGYCHLLGYKINFIKDIDLFLMTVKKTLPLVLVIDMALATKLLTNQVWKLTRLNMKNNHIALCGIGKQLSKSDVTVLSKVFDKIISDPSNISEIESLINTKGSSD